MSWKCPICRNALRLKFRKSLVSHDDFIEIICVGVVQPAKWQ